MKEIEKLLNSFLELLKDENRLLIESIKSKEASDELLKVVEEKDRVLKKILSFDKKDVKPYENLLIKIEELTNRNKLLANNNIEFINEIFESIFEKESTKQYTKDGSLEKPRETLLNKKV